MSDRLHPSVRAAYREAVDFLSKFNIAPERSVVNAEGGVTIWLDGWLLDVSLCDDESGANVGIVRRSR